MRRRTIKKNFFLNYNENKMLREKAFEQGLSESELLRGFIKGYIPKGKPPAEIEKLIYELRKIGNNINQIAYVANKNGDVNYKYFYDYKKELDKLVFEIRDKFYSEKKVDDV